MTLEDVLNRQILDRREKIIEALTEDNLATITVNKLAPAMGVPAQQLQSAAWNGSLPFAWSFHGESAKSKSTRIYKDKFWLWYNNINGAEFERMVKL